jgi:hypothetical protein
MFQKLVHGFDTLFNTNSAQVSGDMLSAEMQRVFGGSAATASSSNFDSSRSIYSFEITPIVPQQANELLNDDYQSQLNQSNSSAGGVGGFAAGSASGGSLSLNLTAELIHYMIEFMQQDVICIPYTFNGERQLHAVKPGFLGSDVLMDIYKGLR